MEREGYDYPAHIAELEIRIKELEDALRAIINRAEHRMSSVVIDDAVAIARAALQQPAKAVRK